MPTARVIDLSHHNTVPESLKPARESGIWGVIHKATEGTGFVDSKLGARFALAQDAGMLWGAYHFLRPGNMAQQADFFVKTMAPYTDYKTLFACDYEVSGITLSDVRDFMDLVEEATGRACVLYSGHVLKEALAKENPTWLAERRLWLAQYASSPTVPSGFALWLWQYSDKGEVPGITPPTDVNAYAGTVDELEASWSGRDAEPAPPPENAVSIQITTNGYPVLITVDGKQV
jgi:lysozyme